MCQLSSKMTDIQNELSRRVDQRVAYTFENDPDFITGQWQFERHQTAPEVIYTLQFEGVVVGYIVIPYKATSKGGYIAAFDAEAAPAGKAAFKILKERLIAQTEFWHKTMWLPEHEETTTN